MRFSKIILTFCLLSLLACASNKASNDPYVDKAVKGGVAGGVLGAGTGAIIGATISSGDVGASALLGGGVGIPAGILLGVALEAYNEETELTANNKIIEANYKSIVRKQREIDQLREEIEADYKTIKLDKSLRDEIYTGESLGSYQR